MAAGRPGRARAIAASGYRAFPPRLPEQPIFYPVLTEEYALQIARDWNLPQSGAGFVTRFRSRSSFLSLYTVHQVGDRHHREYWIPAAELAAFNRAIVGSIEVTRRFP